MCTVVALSTYSMQTHSKFGIFKSKHIRFLSTSVNEVEPTYDSQASKFLQWQKAMVEEYNTLISNHTYMEFGTCSTWFKSCW